MSRLPSALKAMNTFVNGESYVGQAESLTIPKIAFDTEDWKGGLGVAQIPMNLQALVIEHSYMGFVPREIARGVGSPGLGRELIRWVGGYQDQDTGAYQAVEVVAVGSHIEVDPGEQKVGERTTSKAQTTCTYYKLSVSGLVWFEIDILERIFVVDGVDRYAELRAAMNA